MSAISWSPESDPNVLSYWDWTSNLFGEVGRTTTPVNDGDRVFWWDDKNSTRNLRSSDNVARTYLRPTGGPSTGKRSLEWDGTNASAMYYATGSELLSASSFTIGCVFNVSAAGALNALIGRGGYNGNGTYLRIDAANKLVGTVTTAAATSLTVGTAVTTTWAVGAMTYDGSNMHVGIRGQAIQSSAKTGALSFHASDTAFWMGAVTGNGSAWAQNLQKYLALGIVKSDSYTAATLPVFLNQLARYAGIS